MNFYPYSKQKQLGKKRKKQSQNFNRKVKLEILERDNWRCVKCGSYKIMAQPHHIIYKSQGGPGTKDNGATVCINCHMWGHHLRNSVFGEPSKLGKQWFLDWREKNLDENGDYVEGYTPNFRED